MYQKEIHFMGLLSNTDTSIQNVDLDYGFNINTISDKEGSTLISIFEHLPPVMVLQKLFSDFHCLSGEKLYYISNSFKINVEMNDEGIPINLPTELLQFNNDFAQDYLNSVIRLMRLFKEGNICIPKRYYYFIDNNTPNLFMSAGTSLFISPEKYTLENSEIFDLQRFIQNTKLPFAESFLQLAFENFELSYQTHNINLSFLSLMISLETLFNPGNQELRYRVSRNTAVLLGKKIKDAKLIFSEIKELYDKHSKIVHTGKSNIILDDLLKLRYYVRESIKHRFSSAVYIPQGNYHFNI